MGISGTVRSDEPPTSQLMNKFWVILIEDELLIGGVRVAEGNIKRDGKMELITSTIDKKIFFFKSFFLIDITLL